MRNKVYDFGETAYLMGGKTFIEFTDTQDMIGSSNTLTEEIEPINMKKKPIKFVRRGKDNKLPLSVMDKVYFNSHLGANVGYNAKLAYGDGIMVMRKVRDDKGKIQMQELLPSENKEIYDFIRDNNYVVSVQELANDIAVFNESFVEFIFDKTGKKIVRLNSVETSNSRVSESNADGLVEWHGYSTKWHEGESDDLIATPLLHRKQPLLDLRSRIGETAGNQKTESVMLQLMMPTPGNYYYGKPYWWAIFESGWYDFACAIPKFKTSLMKNQMSIRYHVLIAEHFWTKLFKSENIIKDDAQRKRKRKFLTDLNDFLAGEENAGKAFVSHFKTNLEKGKDEKDIIIEPINNKVEGGEYLEDSEEVTNVICYAMDIHPSLIGATGKKGGINGTETRELFIMKQALMKPIRDLLVMPLYIVKAINGWDDDLEFVIPNIMLTTLDKNTGAEKSIGNEKI